MALNKRMPVQPTMSFDYTTPDLRVVASAVVPDIRIDYSADLWAIQRQLEYLQSRTSGFTMLGAFAQNVGEALRTIKEVQLQQDQQRLDSILRYSLTFDPDEYSKLKTPEGKRLYVQAVAANYFKNFEGELTKLFEVDWKDDDPTTVATKAKEYLLAKVEEVIETLPEDVRDSFKAQASTVANYLAVQMKTHAFNRLVESIKQKNAAASENTFKTAVALGMADLGAEFESLAAFVKNTIEPHVLIGGTLADIDDKTGKPYDALYKDKLAELFAQIDGWVDARSDLPEDVREQVRAALKEQAASYAMGLLDDTLNTAINVQQQIAAQATAETRMKLVASSVQLSKIKRLVQDYTNGIVLNTFNLPQTGAGQRPSEEPEIPLPGVPARTAEPSMLAKAIRTEIDTIALRLRETGMFNDLSDGQLRGLVASYVLQDIGEFAVKHGMPELLDFVDVKDADGISLSMVADKNLQQMIQQYREAAIEQANAIAEEQEKMLEEIRQKVVEQTKAQVLVAAYKQKFWRTQGVDPSQDAEFQQFLQEIGATEDDVVQNPALYQVRFLEWHKANVIAQIISDPTLDVDTKQDLIKQFETFSDVEFASTSSPNIYSFLRTQVMTGKMTAYDLLPYATALSEADFHELTRLAMNTQESGLSTVLAQAEKYIDNALSVWKEQLTQTAALTGDTTIVAAIDSFFENAKLAYLEELRQQAAEAMATGQALKITMSDIVTDFNNRMKAMYGIDLTQASLAGLNTIMEQQMLTTLQNMPQDILPAPVLFNAQKELEQKKLQPETTIVWRGFLQPIAERSATLRKYGGDPNQWEDLRKLYLDALKDFANNDLPKVYASALNIITEGQKLTFATPGDIFNTTSVAKLKNYLKSKLSTKLKTKLGSAPLTVTMLSGEQPRMFTGRWSQFADDVVESNDQFFEAVARGILLDQAADIIAQQLDLNSTALFDTTITSLALDVAESLGYTEDEAAAVVQYIYNRILAKRFVLEQQEE
jgi:hypothetical protein